MDGERPSQSELRAYLAMVDPQTRQNVATMQKFFPPDLEEI
jgi:hypothetical protein